MLSIVGAGVLGLPTGMAASFGAQEPAKAVLCCCLLLVTIGAAAAAGFRWIGLASAETGSPPSYRGTWEASVGRTTARMPAAACFLVTACTVLTYSMILADTLPALLPVELDRTAALLGVTIAVLTPLCLMRELKKLAPVSLLGTVGVVYTAAAMTYRWLSGDYSVTTDSEGERVALGKLAADLAPQYVPSFPRTASSSSIFDMLWNPKATILISMLSTSFMAHYNSAKLFHELRDADRNGRFSKTTAAAFAGAVALMAAVAVPGYATFGDACHPLILNNYSADGDGLMAVSKAAVALSLIGGYPLAFAGVRDGLLDLFRVPAEKRTVRLSNMLTVALLTAITGLALVLTDIRIILALGGATWGNLLIYVFPAVMVWNLAKKKHTGSRLKGQVVPAVMTGILGLCLGAIGTTRAVQSM